MKSTASLRVSLIVLMMAALAVPLAQAGSKRKTSSSLPCTIGVFQHTVDEQDTTAYYNDGAEYCSGASWSVLPPAY